MITITATHANQPGATLTAEALTDLRDLLIEEAHRFNRVAVLTPDWNDQIYAVYPPDESELDDGEEVPAPREVTEKLIIDLAASVWDASPRNVTIEQARVSTLQDVAEAVHHRMGIDADAAGPIIEAYIAQVERLDGHTIDPDMIPEDDADFLIEAVASAQRAGDLGQSELEDLAEVVQQIEALESQRDPMIRAAWRAGARVKDIMEATGLSRQRIQQIRGLA